VRLSRRKVLAGGLACLAAPQTASARWVSGPENIIVQATPLSGFSIIGRERRRFGELTFRQGLDLRSSHTGFGGWSGLWRSADGAELVAVSDAGSWFTARVTQVAGILSGLSDARVAPMLSASGLPLGSTRAYDVEGLTIVDGVAYVCIERVQAVLRFNFAREGLTARGRPVPVPADTQKLPRNQGLEAIGMVPRGAALAGALVVIAERSDGHGETTRGWLIGGPKPGGFRVLRRNDFDVTDLAFLPGGDMLILERRFSFLSGLAMRIRRIPAASLAPDAVLDGPVLIEADLGYEIDNMEGMAVHTGLHGETVITLISDDNFSGLQRTLLLEFSLAESA
jgi:hypothetical protein